MATTPNLDKSHADVSDNIRSFKTRKTAEKNADAYADMQEPGQVHGVIFPSHAWNGGYNVPTWVLYDVSETDEGYTITVYRWLREEDEVLTCVHCDEEIVETEGGLLIHKDETYDHLARKA